jgi:hypothetical protein
MNSMALVLGACLCGQATPGPTPADLIEARFLLASPVNETETNPAPEHYAALKAAVIAVATQDELISDEREMMGFDYEPGPNGEARGTEFLFEKPGDWVRHLNLLRERRAELENCPLLQELGRFPSNQTTQSYRSFSQSFCFELSKRIKSGLEVDRADILQATLDEAQQMAAPWNNLHDAEASYLSIVERRKSLKFLKQSLSEEDWRSGSLPPIVPTWRFTERSRR